MQPGYGQPVSRPAVFLGPLASLTAHRGCTLPGSPPLQVARSFPEEETGPVDQVAPANIPCFPYDQI